jgi:hypothetical protein
MVHHHNEHGSAIDTPAPVAIQWELVANHFRYFLRPKYHPIHSLQRHHFLAICTLPENLPRGASTPTPKLVSCYIPRGASNTGKHDGVGMCACMGPGNGYTCLGLMVDCQCAGIDSLLPSDFCGVSEFPSKIASSGKPPAFISWNFVP